MKELQKTQNKLLRFLNKSRIVDKVNSEVILDNLNMCSVNQLSAQIKLTETWKAINSTNSNALNSLKMTQMEGQRESRAASSGNLKETGVFNLAKKTFINDSNRVWNNAPLNIKNAKTLYSAKNR